MRALGTVALGLGLLPWAGVAAAPADPAAAVRAAFMRYDHGWRTFDPAEIVSVVAQDVEWTNSVGLRISGKAKLGAFLVNLFKQASFRAGTAGPLVIHSIRMLGPDVAVVDSSEETYGQKVWDTLKTVPVQRTNELSVMQLQGGKWLIVSDLGSDESHGI